MNQAGMRWALAQAGLMVLLLLSGEVWAQSQVERKVTITWKAVEDAVRYEVHLSTSDQMTPVLHKKIFRELKGAFLLSPGTYYFRVRGMDEEQSPGPWSAVQGFIVNPGPPVQEEPEDRQLFTEELPSNGVTFKWSKGYSGSEYQFEMRDKDGVVLSRNVTGTSFSWKPDFPGNYKWRVGFETPGGAEWSPYRVIRVSSKAVGMSESQKRLLEKMKDKDEMPLIDREDKGGFSLIGRGAQSVAQQSVSKGSNGASTTSSSVQGALSAELRWRADRNKGRKWGLSGSLNFEILKRKFSDGDDSTDDSFIEPRVYARLFATQVGNHFWRHGPFLHIQFAKVVIIQFNPDGVTAIPDQSTSVSRLQPGLGYVAVYQAAKTMYFSGLFLLRYDMGGSSSEFAGNGKLNSNIGFEAGFGVVINLSPKLFLEVRVRGQGEYYSWPDTSGTSRYGNTYIIGDAGIGYTF